MKLKDIRSKNGQSYFRFWSIGLKALLGWSDQDVEQWADKFGEWINNENDFLFHYLPGTYIVSEYMDEHCPGWRERISNHEKGSANAMREISDCVNDVIYPDLRRGVGWQEARLRIEAATKRLGLV